MKKLLFLLAVPCWAVTYAPVSGWCELGGQVTVTNAVNSTTFTQRSYKGCTIAVRDTMGNLATIYSDSTGTALGNPFTASATTGQWTFYTGQGEYSVTRSGGGIPAPFSQQFFVPMATSGITTLNALTAATQAFAVGTSGTDFAIVSATSTHTFNLPTASASNRGALSTTDWSTFNSKQSALSFTAPLVNTAGTVALTLPITIARGGTGQVTQTLGFNALSPLTTKGDILVHDGTNNIRFGKPADGFSYIGDSGQASGLNTARFSQISALTANILPKGIGTTGYTNSSVTDDGTNVISGEVFKFRALSIGTTPPALVSAGGATVAFLEGTAPGTCAASTADCLYADSTTHTLKVSYNNGTYYRVPQAIANGTSTMGTGAISSGACATTVTTAATGTATTDVVKWSFNGSPLAVTGYAAAAAGMLTVYAWPSANNINFSICNGTVGSITPGSAVTFNWIIER